MSVRRIESAAAGGASITIAPYEYPLVWDFVGEGRYLQAAVCKSVAQLYSAKFDTLTTKNLSSFAAKGAYLGLLEWSKEIGCRWEEAVFVSGASGGSIEVLEWLLDNACPIPKDAAPCTAAALEGNIEALKFLRVCNCHADRTTYTAAAKIGRLDVLQCAHRFRWGLNVHNVFETACENGQIHILKWIHETLSVDGLFSERTYSEAAFRGRLDVLTWLRSVGCAWNALTCWEAIRGGHLDCLRWAMKEGCPWTVTDRRGGETSLHVASDAGHAEIVEFLINSGADLNAVEGEWAWTPIYCAAWEGHVECVEVLLAAGADMNKADTEGTTPLAVAISEGRTNVVQVLRAAGARE